MTTVRKIGKVHFIFFNIKILILPPSTHHQINTTNKGREAPTVYNIIYLPAWSRSG